MIPFSRDIFTIISMLGGSDGGVKIFSSTVIGIPISSPKFSNPDGTPITNNLPILFPMLYRCALFLLELK